MFVHGGRWRPALFAKFLRATIVLAALAALPSVTARSWALRRSLPGKIHR